MNRGMSLLNADILCVVAFFYSKLSVTISKLLEFGLFGHMRNRTENENHLKKEDSVFKLVFFNSVLLGVRSNDISVFLVTGNMCFVRTYRHNVQMVFEKKNKNVRNGIYDV